MTDKYNNSGIDESRKIEEYFQEFDKISGSFGKNGRQPPDNGKTIVFRETRVSGKKQNSSDAESKAVTPSRNDRHQNGKQPRTKIKRVTQSGLPEEYSANSIFNDRTVTDSAHDRTTFTANPTLVTVGETQAAAVSSGRITASSTGAGHATVVRQPRPSPAVKDKNMKKSKKKAKRRWLFIPIRLIFFILLIFGITAAVTAYGWVMSVIASLPDINPNDISSFLAQNSTLYDDDGNVIDDIFFSDEGLRTNVMYDEIPKNMVNAIIAVEDKTFWTHRGFNFVRIVGAVRDSVFNQTTIRGTSTISQQLARNIWLEETKSDYSLTRKIREAFYAMQLENRLTKEQILEAYLNTIPLGSRSYGVQAAAQTYFSKDVQELNLIECVALASLPQAPGKYSLIQTVEREKISEENPNLLAVGAQYAYVYNGAVETRIHTVLDLMYEQGYISLRELEEAKAVKLKDLVRPRTEYEVGGSNYFADYAINAVVEDLMVDLEIDEDKARQMVYTSGLKIYTTINTRLQKLIDAEFTDNSNFPNLTPKKDRAGNILNVESGAILLYNYNNFFDEEGNFTFKSDEYERQNNGDLLLFGGKRLNFYNVSSGGEADISVEFKDLFKQEDKTYYFIRGGAIFINKGYKTKTENGDLIIKKTFFDENPGIFEFQGDNIIIRPASYTLREGVVQPQSAMVLLDYKTGAIKAMAGGRNIEGRMLFNRADSPRQPGSSIKPLSVYGPALQMGADGEPVENGERSYGDYWTAASGIVDEPIMVGDKIWPKNWYSGYRGMNSLRRSVEQSINVNAVKVFANIGADRSLRFLKKLGVTTVVESGRVNDMNPAALALGGMTNGISPLQMAAGYGTYGNLGLYVKPRSYYRITNRRDEIIIDHEPESTQVMDKGTAWLMGDILRTTVTNGIASRAAIPSQPVAGKTGTTNDKCDAWFVGYTPQYSASLWIGCDVSVELSEGSVAATRVWSKIMTQICDGLERGTFPDAPSNIVSFSVDSYSGLLPTSYSSSRSEYFISGTEPSQRDSSSKPVYLCPVSGFLATPYCPGRIAYVKTEGSSRPSFYCNLHNLDPEYFPSEPERDLIDDFYWDGVYRDENYYEDQNQSLEESEPDFDTTAPSWFLTITEDDTPINDWSQWQENPAPFEPYDPFAQQQTGNTDAVDDEATDDQTYVEH